MLILKQTIKPILSPFQRAPNGKKSLISTFFFTYPSITCSLVVPAFANDDIIITAERRAIDQSEIAASISSIDQIKIDRMNADHPAEILNTTPGVFIHRGSGQEHLTAIRSPVLTGGAGAGSFLFLENGVPLRAAGFANVNGLFEAQHPFAERYEVTRGPSGAFYGANAIHGVINVITPSSEANNQKAAFSISKYHQKAKASVARYNRGKGFFAGFAIAQDTGFRNDSGADQQYATIRVDDNTGEWQKNTIITTTNLNQETAGFITGIDAYKDASVRTVNPNPEAYRDSKSLRIQQNYTLETDQFDLKITPYARITEMEFLQHFLPSKAIEKNGHWSLGLQTALYQNNGLTLGFDTEYTEGYLEEVQTNATVFSFVQGIHYDYRIAAGSISPFIQRKQALSDKLTLTSAARLDWTKYDYKTNTEANRFGRFIRPENRTDSFLTFSPKINLAYKEGRNLFWFNLARGARPPQTTDLYRLQLNQEVQDIEPETIDSVELGWKSKINSATTAEIIGFHAEKENFLFRDADGFTVLDGKTRHQGIEVLVQTPLTDKIDLNLNATFVDHTYQFDRPVNSTRNATEAITKGNQIDTAPRQIAGAQLTWKITPHLSTQADWVHVSDYYTDAANQHTYSGHDVFNLQAQTANRFATSFVQLRNIFDHRYAERADFAFNTDRYFPDAGRTLTFGIRFEN